MREAELCLRPARSSRSRAAVQPDEVGGWQDGDGAPAARHGAGEGGAGSRRVERFKSLTGQIAEVNEAICDARPALPQQARTAAPDPEGQKKGSARRSRQK